jgi:hypothetical protein
MPELKWKDNEVIECLGVLPETDEFFTSHLFRKVFGLVRLELTIWENESLVALSLFEEHGSDPFIDLSFIVRDRIEFVTQVEYSSLRFHNSVVVTGRFWRIHDEDKNDWFDTKLLPTNIGFELATYPKFEFKVF